MVLLTHSWDNLQSLHACLRNTQWFWRTLRLTTYNFFKGNWGQIQWKSHQKLSLYVILCIRRKEHVSIHYLPFCALIWLNSRNRLHCWQFFLGEECTVFKRFSFSFIKINDCTTCSSHQVWKTIRSSIDLEM